MASLTVRQLDDKLKKLLRLRAARHSRSMEDEVRVILREAAEQTATFCEHFEPPSQSARQKARAAEANGNRVLLIIGGGIAAYKSLDLIRRLQDRGAQVRCILTAAAQHFVTPLAAGALSGERVFTDLFDPHSEFDVGHIRLAARHRSRRRRAGDGGPVGEDGRRPRRRSRHRRSARDRQADPDRAGDESADVGRQGDGAQSGAAPRRRRAHRRAERRRDGRARRRGTILFTGSTSSLLGRAGHLNLAVGKSGQCALAQVLPRELCPLGIPGPSNH